MITRIRFFFSIFTALVLTSMTLAQDSEPEKKAAADQKQMDVKKEISPEMKADIQKLLKINGEEGWRMAALNRAFLNFKQTVPGVKDEFWKECQKLFTTEALFEVVIPIYAEAYSHEEIKQLTQFFESPVGQKFAKSSSQVQGRGNHETNLLARRLGAIIVEKLDKAGYDH